MLLGCVQREFFPEVNAATARVLSAEGCDVHIPASQGCCGALMLHSGLADDAAAAARRLIDAFDISHLDHIVVNAAGCGSAMKEYGDLLRNDPDYAEPAREFAAKCLDVSELIATLEPRANRIALPWKVAYHDACHLQHAQRVKTAPRQVLATIPGLEVKEIGESEICCGSAGVLQPTRTRRRRRVARPQGRAHPRNRMRCAGVVKSRMFDADPVWPGSSRPPDADPSLRGTTRRSDWQTHLTDRMPA
jgi:Fe-S oxidoreductase